MTRPLKVVFTRLAERHAETIHTWWAANRTASPLLFQTELARTLDLIAVTPTIGAPAKSKRLSRVRRVLLPKTKYHVYYRAEGDSLVILALWHAKRIPPHV